MVPRLAPLSRSGNGPRGTSSRLGRPDGVCPQFPADHGAAPGDSARLRPARRGDQRAESSTIDPQLRNMVSQMASRAAGCDYCMAHTAHAAERVGIAAEKENALWEFERSPLFSEAERAALRVAQRAAQVPNAVTDADFAELKKHYSEAQIVDIVAVISLFGFLNRFNDTMATELEASPIEAGKRFLAKKGWSI